MDTIYTLSDVCKEYTGDYNVFNYLNISLPKSAVTGVLGGQWSGKSTLLSMLAGVESYKGSITLNGKELSEIKPTEANIGYVAENLNLFNHKSALYNLTFPMKIRNYSADKIECYVEKCLKSLSFDLNAKIEKLTSFQRAQIALYRLFSLPRNVILIDGLFDNDGRYSENELDNLIEIFKNNISLVDSVVISAETLEVLERLKAQFVVVLAYGSITDYGGIEEIKKYPNTLASYKLLHKDCKIVEAEVIDKKLFTDGNCAGIFDLESNIFDKVLIACEDFDDSNGKNETDINKISKALVYDFGSEKLISKHN